jgi:hypothetical protein
MMNLLIKDYRLIFNVHNTIYSCINTIEFYIQDISRLSDSDVGRFRYNANNIDAKKRSYFESKNMISPLSTTQP